MDEARASVEAALELLQEEAAALVDAARAQGAEAYVRGDTKAFERIDGQRQSFEEFADAVGTLVVQWSKSNGQRRRTQTPINSNPKLSPGQLAPYSVYIRPILQVLVDQGGESGPADVLAAVEKIVSDQLTPDDYTTVTGDVQRWRNRAHWVRSYLARGLYLRPDSPRGVWEITSRGRSLLQSSEDAEAVWQRLRKMVVQEYQE